LEHRFGQLLKDMEDHGFAVCDHFISDAEAIAIHAEARQLFGEGEFRDAYIGHGITEQRVSEVRGDRILWLDPDAISIAQRVYWDEVTSLRESLSDYFRISLPWAEMHLAAYPPGSFYARHLDQFRDTGNRIFSVILYLNPDWRQGDGGELRIHLPGGHLDVAPVLGRLACFRSDLVEHEVLVAHRTRFSLTGWMRRDQPIPVFL
jgi:SM-20-related protein